MSGQGAQIVAYMLSCPERERTRMRTLANLRATDWGAAPIVEIDTTSFARRQERQEHTAHRLLQRAVADGALYVLFLEDDLTFNRALRHNLGRWGPFVASEPDGHFFASLYNPTIRELERRAEGAYFVADPACVYGSQAFLLSRATARAIVSHWHEVPGMQDIKMSRLAARGGPLFYHLPSLVQHIGAVSAWGGHFHTTRDFSADWRA